MLKLLLLAIITLSIPSSLVLARFIYKTLELKLEKKRLEMDELREKFFTKALESSQSNPTKLNT